MTRSYLYFRETVERLLRKLIEIENGRCVSYCTIVCRDHLVKDKRNVAIS